MPRQLSPGWFRLFLATVVVLFHTSKIVFFGFWAVFVFFVLSGYWIAEMYREKYSKIENAFVTFEMSRFLRIFPTFLAISFLAVAVIVSGYGDLKPESLKDVGWLARSFCLFGSSAVPTRLIETQWSLDIELQFYLFFPLLFSVIAKPTNLGWLLCGGYLGVLFVIFGLVDSLALYLPFFGAGVLLSQTKWKAGLSTLVGSFVVIVLVFLFIVVYPESRRSVLAFGNVQVFRHDVTRMVDVILTFAALPFVAINVRNRETKLGFHAGNLSFPLYLVHWVALGPYVALYGHLPLWSRLPYFVAYLVVCLVVSLIIYIFIDRPIDGWRRNKIRHSRKTHTLSGVANG